VDRTKWAAEHVRIPDKVATLGTTWDPDLFPYERGVLDALDSPEVRTVVLMWATRTGKTQVWLVFVVSNAVLDPGPTMIVSATQDSAQRLSRLRLYPMLAACSETAGQLLPKHEQQSLLVDLRDMLALLAWSGSPTMVGEQAIRYLMIPEADLHSTDASAEGDSVQLALERVKGFPNNKVLIECSPSEEGASRIATWYEAGDRRRYWVPCPFCGQFQPLDFEQVRWPEAKGADGHTRSAEAAHDAAFYACVHCYNEEKREPRIRDRHKPEMLRRGLWVREGEVVELREGQPVVVGEAANPSRHIWSSRLSSLYSPNVTFGEMAEAFLRCGKHPERLKTFWNKWLAKPWQPITGKPDWEQVRDRLRTARRRRVVPEGAFFLTGGVDVQKYAFYYTINAWGRDGKAWLVEHGEEARLDPSWQTIRDFVSKFVLEPVFRDEAGTEWQVKVAGVDTGYDTNLVYAAIADLAPERVMAMKGDTGRGTQGKFWRSQAIEVQPETGKPFAGSMRLFHANTHFGKEQFYSLIDEGTDPSVRYELHAEPDESLVRQLTAESLEPRRQKRTGREVFEWVLVDRQAGNHYLDATVMQLAVADILGIRGMTDPDRPRREGRPRGRVEMRGPKGYWRG